MDTKEELCRQVREVDAPKPSARISRLKDADRSVTAERRGIEPRGLRQLLDGDLDVVVVKAIEKDRDRRYGTPQDLAADIDRFLDNQPVIAVRPSALYLKDAKESNASPGESSLPIYENDSIIMSVEFTPDAADHNGFVRIWDTATWTLEETLKFPRLTAMDISDDGSLLALGFGDWNDSDQGIILWDLKAGKRRHTLVGQRPFAIAFSPDGKTLAATSERHDVVLWDVATGLPLRKLEGHATTVNGAAFSPDGTQLATTDFYGNLHQRHFG